MLSIEAGGKPQRLPASRKLLVPAMNSDTNVFISAAMHAERVCLRFGSLDLTRPSRAIQFPQFAKQALSYQPLLKALF
ncbi:hypothetical protein TNCV_469471 [Trichonephila clavipes]|nr:hypothetical protein TNCV_469471 [Trichonephila clavipes]